MKRVHKLTLSPLECVALSFLLVGGRKDGLSPTALSALSGLSRPVLYVMLRRLFTRKLVRQRTTKRAEGGVQTIYFITAAGERARAAFAFELGVWPP
jgi:DNA-binding IclR family transcriptional regulator